jgi:Icc-related predicted phosphoesterase
MKLHLLSDLHIEFGQCPLPPGGEVLVLAGDIHVGNRGSDWIEECLKIYDQVYYILGNHEFYNNDLGKVKHWWQEAAKYRDNFEVLDNHVHTYNDVRFIGTTLWTPTLQGGLNDYHIIHYAGHTLTPHDTQQFNMIAVQFLEDALAQPWDGETVVVTHHAPVPECVVPKYNGNMMNPNFHCYLNDMIANNDITYWLHGHMHDSIFIEQDGTCIVCNPRGYIDYGANTGWRNPCVLEV